MTSIDLVAREWKLSGWRPYSWRLGRSMELGMKLYPDVGPLPAIVPGSAHSALLAQGLIKDWHRGLASLDCEWVENRHWEFSTVLPAGFVPSGQSVTLCADGLDYSGWILVDGRTAATFSGALVRHRFDLTRWLADGCEHELSLVFDKSPEEQGQIGFTSQSRIYKPRFSFSWDWCPRFVPIGITDQLRLEVGERKAEVTKILAELQDDLTTGRVTVSCLVEAEACTLTLDVLQSGRVMASEEYEVTHGDMALTLMVRQVEPWWPNGEGDQPLYTLIVRDGEDVIAERRVGFKRVRWLPCQGAPEGALPWICEINGRAVFLQGVNWTPVQVDYPSVNKSQYARLIDLYREMGANLLRVWGGAFLERESFYDLCDEAGLLVWQEFPLSSSGIDNWPPEEDASIREICAIARDYIRRRAHHASKLMWCGGNELQGGKDGSKIGTGRPCGMDHPCLAALGRVAAEEDPGTRYVPASASGPRFTAEEEEYGQGLHHDVHGPWNVSGTWDDWRRYWSDDDALFRSEAGVPGAMSHEMLLKYAGDSSCWPPTIENPYWRHTSAWWLQWERFQGSLDHLAPQDAMARYIELSQTFQAQALGMAAEISRSRFPRCGGFLVWMGHDTFPCPSNTAVIDFEGNPKPAYRALQKAFHGENA